MSNEVTAGMMAKVRALLDKAEASEFPAEQATYRGKAEELMVKYRIEEEHLLATGHAEMVAMPIHYDITLCGPSAYVNHYVTIFGNIARHTGIRVTYQWDYSGEDRRVVARGVGYEADVRYAELLFTQARLVFSERLEPKVNPELGDQVNVYRLRSAGIERIRIADIMWGNTDKVFLGRVGRLYKAECAQRGEEPALSGRGVTGAAYREQYSDQFVWTLSHRLVQARDAAGRSGGGLVLANREEQLNESFYQRFPTMRPKASVEAGDGTGTYEPCAKCAKAKRGNCNEHPRGPAGPRGRDYDSVAAVRGRAAGASAARAVELGRGTHTGQVSN